MYEYVKEVPSAKVGCWVVRVFRQNEAMLVVVEVYFLREILKETTREIQDTELHNTTTQQHLSVKRMEYQNNWFIQ